MRLGLGCHFLYEGIWKIKHADEFSAGPFLTVAKGPLAPVFYAMIPDIDGDQRLAIVVEKDDKGNTVERIQTADVEARWKSIRDRFLGYYAPNDVELTKKSAEVYERHLDLLTKYLAENLADIKGYFNSLERFRESANHHEAGQTAPFQEQRRWETMQKLRGEVNGWLAAIDKQEKNYVTALMDIRNAEQKAKGPLPPVLNPLEWNRVQQLTVAVTVSLTAIGLCLLLGLCTRLAALGGAAFMCFVVATQPAWPTLYPPDPAVVGHALLINKDFIELLALLVIASAPVGRWAGLDFFLYRIFSGWRNRGRSSAAAD